MSDPIPNPTANPNPSRPLVGLLKQRSWSPDSDRDEAWLRRKGIHRGRRGRLIRSVTDEDLDELRGCIDLGFGFDAECSESGKRLAETLPALDLYYAVRKSYHSSIAEGNSSPLDSSSSSIDGSPMGSPLSIFSPGGSPEMMKARLKQWAQVVACSLRQRC
ncbi:uncharacterized protein [Typha angustifolia]|uniref:uncharacterized protein n=1 Tax=Typha angustifolia TaxID=59011 RepID=UPI003C30723A